VLFSKFLNLSSMCPYMQCRRSPCKYLEVHSEWTRGYEWLFWGRSVRSSFLVSWCISKPNNTCCKRLKRPNSCLNHLTKAKRTLLNQIFSKLPTKKLMVHKLHVAIHTKFSTVRVFYNVKVIQRDSHLHSWQCTCQFWLWEVNFVRVIPFGKTCWRFWKYE